MGSDAAYTHYAPRSRAGSGVTISRASWRGPDVPGHVACRRLPARRRRCSKRFTIHSGSVLVVTLPTPAKRFVVSVHVDPTFSPASYGRPDTRQLGAQVSFTYPAR